MLQNLLPQQKDIHLTTAVLQQPVADPIKLYFFANKEFFRFSLVSLCVCYIYQKLINSKMT